jgi:lipopolysaccharide transport system ATP-binding protein
MSSELAIAAQGLGKCYSLYEQPGDRLKQLVWGRWRSAPYYRDFWALKDVNFNVAKGEVLGIVGRNGAGKSTLLQMVCGTLQPSAGQLSVNGRVAALLELGAGFNPDFTGRENVYMNAAILGLNRTEVDARLDDILAFADIGRFVDQAVKTYSSGMYMRLAFAVATSVEPDILVIDEALSVGDGAFARKSFDRIMGMKEAGKTILFCSHSMYQVEALCSRALWMEGGTLRMAGSAAEVTAAYQSSLNAPSNTAPAAKEAQPVAQAAPGTGRIVKVLGQAGSHEGTQLAIQSGETDLTVTISFVVDASLPSPGVALGISDSNGLTVASVSSINDGMELMMDSNGHGSAHVTFMQLPLLKGRYSVTSFLLTEDGVHIYEQVERSLLLDVTQRGLEQGLVALPHRWQEAP